MNARTRATLEGLKMCRPCQRMRYLDAIPSATTPMKISIPWVLHHWPWRRPGGGNRREGLSPAEALRRCSPRSGNGHSMRPVTQPNELAKLGSFWRERRGVLAVVAGAVALAALPACDLPFNLSQPSTRALQDGAVASLSASSFEIKGTYTAPGYASPQSHASG